MACQCLGVLGQSPANVEDVRGLPLAKTERVKRWLLGLPVNDDVLWNALCMVLPSVADHDPAFAKLILDPDTWKAVVRTDASLTNEEKAQRLELIRRGYFCHVLNNALLHVLGALANNHFDLRFLGPSSLGGQLYRLDAPLPFRPTDVAIR
jgi:hypothetical protein